MKTDADNIAATPPGPWGSATISIIDGFSRGRAFEELPARPVLRDCVERQNGGENVEPGWGAELPRLRPGGWGACVGPRWTRGG